MKSPFWAMTAGVLSVVLVFAFLVMTRAADRRRFETELGEAIRLVKVVVAARDLPAGTIIEAGDVEAVKGVAAHLPLGVIGEVGQSIGQEVSSDILSGEALHSKRLIGTERIRAASMIGKGRVALAIQVDDVSGVGGGVRPSDRVDVLATDADLERTTRLLTNIRVLGTAGLGHFSRAIAEGQLAPPVLASEAIVLELLPHQAITVADAAQAGSVVLTLRGRN